MDNISRRHFLSALGSWAAGLSLTGFSSSAMAEALQAALPRKAPLIKGRNTRLSYLANRSFSGETFRRVDEIQGQWPSSLQGDLFRIGPGSKRAFGEDLNHFFDGDALLTKVTFDQSGITVRSAFVETLERLEEKRAGRRLYHDFGTGCENAKGHKNPPSVNVVPYGSKLMTLSEGAHPVAVDPETLTTWGHEDFNQSLDTQLTFTAHPRRDPLSGDLYTYGISKSMFPNLKVFKLPAGAQNLQEIGSYSLGGFYPVHDMMITQNYVIFLIPPLSVSMRGALLQKEPMANLLEYQPSKPLRIVVFKKEKTNRQPLVLTSFPAGMSFHHCNGYEDENSGHVILDSIIADDDSVFDVLKNWGNADLGLGPASRIVRFELDLNQGKVLSRSSLTDGTPCDFPAVQAERLGYRQDAYYVVEALTAKTDALALNGLARWDLTHGKVLRVSAEADQTFGEPLLVSDGNQSWILHMGFDAKRDQSFLDLRISQDLAPVARVWLGQFIPLGFHGCFIRK